MLIGSSYEAEMFINSVIPNAHGLEVFLEELQGSYRLMTRSFSEISGKRFYQHQVEMVRGDLIVCLRCAQNICVVDPDVLRNADLLN
ncbi:MAG: hypothetical protein ACI4VX_02890 [Succinivibrionaceae bacterium]